MDDINMGNWDAPSVLMFITQGAGDFLEGTSPHRSLGAGDGIMITEYVRTHSRQYCTADTQTEYRRHPYLSHILAAVPWLVEGYYRLEGRFNGKPVTDNCSTIPEGKQALDLPRAYTSAFPSDRLTCLATAQPMARTRKR